MTTRTRVTIGWLLDGLTTYQATVLLWYLPAYVRDDDWQ